MPFEQVFHRAITPRHVSQPAKGERDIGDLSIFHPCHCRNGDQRKSIGGAVAYLAVDVACIFLRSGKNNSGDDLARFQRVVVLRTVAGQAVEILQRDGALCFLWPLNVHLGTQRTHRDCHIAGMRCNTGIAGAENGMDAVEPFAGVTARARIAFVAGHIGVVEVVAPRALAQVTASRRLVAQLSRSTGQQCA